MKSAQATLRKTTTVRFVSSRIPLFECGLSVNNNVPLQKRTAIAPLDTHNHTMVDAASVTLWCGCRNKNNDRLWIAKAFPRAAAGVKPYLMQEISTCGLTQVMCSAQAQTDEKLVSCRKEIYGRPSPDSQNEFIRSSVGGTVKVVPNEHYVKNATRATGQQTNITIQTVRNKQPTTKGYTPIDRQNRCTTLVPRQKPDGVEHTIFVRVMCTGAHVCRALCTTCALHAHVLRT